MQTRRDPIRWALTTLVIVTFLGTAAPISSQARAGEFPLNSSRDVRVMKAKVRAAQFLSKATFGPTQESIDELAARIAKVGYKRATSEWIDAQFALPRSSHEDIVRDIIYIDNRETDTKSIGAYRYRYQAWWDIALRKEDQLRQRVAWALSQIFVIGSSGAGFNNDSYRLKISSGAVVDPENPTMDERTVTDWVGMSIYYDMLASGIDGTYRELLEDVTYSPCMGTWLSSVRNRKANTSAGRYPDENYAREIMQLFSVGLYELHQDGRLKVDEDGNLIPTYDNTQIKELARLFTGFRYYHVDNRTSIFTGRNLGDPMQIFTPEHDNNYNYTDEPDAPNSKTVFGTVLPPIAQPIGPETIRDEIGAGLDAIANHPNVAPFICRLLIQRLVKSNPSRAYMRRVTRVFNDNGQGVRGDFRAVVKAILTDPELYRGQRVVRLRNPTRVNVVVRGTEYSRLREPVNRITSFIRAMRPTSDWAGGYQMLRNGLGGEFGQWPFDSPSVFNYYLPEFQPPGDLIEYTPSRRNPHDALFAPEFQILNAITSNRTINRLRIFARAMEVRRSVQKGTCTIKFHLEEELELARDLDNMDEILARFDLWLCNGTLKEETKTIIKDAVIAETEGRDWMYRERLRMMLLAVLISPDCAVEQ